MALLLLAPDLLLQSSLALSTTEKLNVFIAQFGFSNGDLLAIRLLEHHGIDFDFDEFRIDAEVTGFILPRPELRRRHLKTGFAGKSRDSPRVFEKPLNFLIARSENSFNPQPTARNLTKPARLLRLGSRRCRQHFQLSSLRLLTTSNSYHRDILYK